MSALEDRRQNARETGQDQLPGYDTATPAEAHAAIEIAIETATRVQITRELIDAYTDADNIDDGLAAAFTAAGFEVVQ